nr:hypothetical protein HmN_000962600 [Hymenolepis microstoma]
MGPTIRVVTALTKLSVRVLRTLIVLTQTRSPFTDPPTVSTTSITTKLARHTPPARLGARWPGDTPNTCFGHVSHWPVGLGPS